MLYDTKCLELANAFLRPEDAAYAHELAQRIQAVIEDFLDEKKLDSQ